MFEKNDEKEKEEKGETSSRGVATVEVQRIARVAKHSSMGLLTTGLIL